MERFEAVLEPFGPGAAVVVPFDPKEKWGRVRAPVRGTIDGYPFRTTVSRYGGVDYLAFRREIRAGAGVQVGSTVAIEVDLDTEERTVEVPDDLAAALDDAGVREAFDRLSYTHRREYVEWVTEARREETRRSRVDKAVGMLRAGTRTPR